MPNLVIICTLNFVTAFFVALGPKLPVWKNKVKINRQLISRYRQKFSNFGYTNFQNILIFLSELGVKIVNLLKPGAARHCSTEQTEVIIRSLSEGATYGNMVTEAEKWGIQKKTSNNQNELITKIVNRCQFTTFRQVKN